eukprot:3565413-Rhodomonas_salina.2
MSCVPYHLPTQQQTGTDNVGCCHGFGPGIDFLATQLLAVHLMIFAIHHTPKQAQNARDGGFASLGGIQVLKAGLRQLQY